MMLDVNLEAHQQRLESGNQKMCSKLEDIKRLLVFIAKALIVANTETFSHGDILSTLPKIVDLFEEYK